MAAHRSQGTGARINRRRRCAPAIVVLMLLAGCSGAEDDEKSSAEVQAEYFAQTEERSSTPTPDESEAAAPTPTNEAAAADVTRVLWAYLITQTAGLTERYPDQFVAGAARDPEQNRADAEQVYAWAWYLCDGVFSSSHNFDLMNTNLGLSSLRPSG